MRQQGKARIISENEIKRVIQFQKNAKHGSRNICLVHFSFYLGLRAKELAELLVKDVIFPDGNLKKEILLTREMTKGAKQRTVFLTNPKVVSVLSSYLNERKENDQWFDLDSPLFRSQKNQRFTAQTICMLFRKIYDDVGLSDCSSHSGRRTFATALLNNGINIRNVQTLLGHSSITTTAIYIDTNPKMLGDISRNLKIS